MLASLLKATDASLISSMIPTMANNPRVVPIKLGTRDSISTSVSLLSMLSSLLGLEGAFEAENPLSHERRLKALWL